MTSFSWNDLTTVFIVILMTLSAVTNFLLVIDILVSSRLRNIVFNVCVGNLALINVMQSVTIAIFSVSHLVGHQWLLNPIVCSWNCWLSSVLDAETIFAVTLMTVDRAIVALSPRLYDSHMSFCRLAVMLAAIWTIGITFFAPVIFNDFRSRFHPVSLSCVMYGILCTCFPLVITFFAMAIILLRIHQFRRRLRKIKRNKIKASTHQLKDFYEQARRGIYSLLVFCAFFVLHGPYLTFELLSHIMSDVEIGTTYLEDITVTWIKTIFLLIFPFLSFFLYSDIRAEFKNLLCIDNEG
ncbi:unnamed protein product [Soboliphyme baturini]|uniref:G_PROTEIN_RECEP_F1_2 domain-containing protein n=1 Tax=Soboliphyme baturini TaxID=241478 RepID=A0A183INS6_9BILA|nr:unnamed protein product [Soboliphyme baturini]